MKFRYGITDADLKQVRERSAKQGFTLDAFEDEWLVDAAAIGSLIGVKDIPFTDKQQAEVMMHICEVVRITALSGRAAADQLSNSFFKGRAASSN